MSRHVLLLVSVLAACAEPPTTGPDDNAPDDVPTLGPPGRVALRRLNRSEYRRTVRDLLGIDSPVAADLPVDDQSHGFDTVAEALGISPLLVELYERSAAALAATIVRPSLKEPVSLWFEAEEAFTTDAGAVTGAALIVWSRGVATGTITVPETGRYRISAVVWGDQVGNEPVRATLGLLAETPVTFDVWARDVYEAETLSIEVDLTAGSHVVEIGFLNDYYDATWGLDRNLRIDAVHVEGPLDFRPGDNPAWNRVMVCDPAEADDPRACAAQVLSAFAPRAWRRPLEDAELVALLGLYDEVVAAGDPPRVGLEMALRAVLASPDFVLIVEPSPPPGASGTVPVDPWALASRLSYLLWSSMPDDALLARAADGSLADPEVLAAEARRMLDDPRASALAEDFAGQWLLVRALAGAAPDFWTYPGFTEDLRASMREGMLRDFEELIFEDRPLTDIVDGRSMWLDRALGRHVGLLSPPADWERMDVGALGRRGFLTAPGLLTATSYPTRTSPVRRGVWVLSNLLCEAPEPPPPGVEAFPDAQEGATTVRERLELHRTNPACAGCHQAIDPIGLAFEHFDGVGWRRETEAGVPVDAVGELPDGTILDGVEGLAAVLREDPRFLRCVAEKFFVHAHGRGLRPEDHGYVDAIRDATVEGGGTLEALIVALVTSDTFRTREVTP